MLKYVSSLLPRASSSARLEAPRGETRTGTQGSSTWSALDRLEHRPSSIHRQGISAPKPAAGGPPPLAELQWSAGPDVVVGGAPESVLIAGDWIYASNLGENRGAGPGYLVRISRETMKIDPDFRIEGLGFPTGMARVGDTLYIVDRDRIASVSIARGELGPVVDLSATGESALNDVVALDDGRLVATGVNTRALYLVDPSVGSFRALETGDRLEHPNGITYDSSTKTLFVSHNTKPNVGKDGNGAVTALRLDGTHAKPLWTSRAGKFVDGVVLAGHEVWVSDWNGFGPDGRLFAFNRFDGRPAGHHDFGIPGFADFDWDPNATLLVTPKLSEGSVSFQAATARPVIRPSFGGEETR